MNECAAVDISSPEQATILTIAKNVISSLAGVVMASKEYKRAGAALIRGEMSVVSGMKKYVDGVGFV